ncbi:MAG: DinB family protein [Chloroflexota bacterium]|nr:DinB family protein [Chloroflexota bacterium]
MMTEDEPWQADGQVPFVVVESLQEADAMREEQPTASVFYAEWAKYQQALKDALAPLTMEQLSLQAAPTLRSIGEIAEHIIAARAWWFKGFMGEGSEEIARYFSWDEPDAPRRSADDLVGGLDRTWDLMVEALSRWSASDMQHTFPHEWRGESYNLSRSWVVWHVLEHDLHHGGELSITLGMHGLQAPDI